MNSPEYGEQSSEKAIKAPLIDRLEKERDAIGGTNEYITELIDMYDSSKEHHPNMLQLQRLAHLFVDADTTHQTTSNQAFAFYKGEVLGYTAAYYLKGEDWPDKSYKLLNKQFGLDPKNFKSRADYEEEKSRATNQTYAERINEMALTTIGGLENSQPGTISSIFDEMIEEWADNASDDPQEQIYLMMGFRYILSHIVQTPPKETSPDDGFSAIVEDEVEDITYPKVESIDHVRDEIMDSFAKHYTAYKITGEEQGDEYEFALDYLVLKMLQDFEKNTSIEFEDDVIIAGKVMTISEDELSETEGSIAETLAHDVRVEGRVSQIVITDIPGMSLFTNPNTSEMNRYGVCLALTNVILISDDGTRTFIPETTTFSVVLSYPDVVLRKYV